MVVEAFVLLLIGLVVPIALLLAALLVDIGVLLWAGYRTWTDRIQPQLAHVFGHLVRPAQRPGHAVG